MSWFNLKNTLVVDGVTCTGLFLLGVFATAPAAALLGLPENIVAIAGWIGLPSAIAMFFVATQKQPSPLLATLIAFGNLLWVVASFAVLVMFAAQMSWLGIAVVVLQALIVLEFAIFEYRGAKLLGEPQLAVS